MTEAVLFPVLNYGSESYNLPFLVFVTIDLLINNYKYIKCGEENWTRFDMLNR